MLTKAREAEIRNNPFHPNGRGSDYLEAALRDVLAALDSERQTGAMLRGGLRYVQASDDLTHIHRMVDTILGEGEWK